MRDESRLVGLSDEPTTVRDAFFADLRGTLRDYRDAHDRVPELEWFHARQQESPRPFAELVDRLFAEFGAQQTVEKGGQAPSLISDSWRFLHRTGSQSPFFNGLLARLG